MNVFQHFPQLAQGGVFSPLDGGTAQFDPLGHFPVRQLGKIGEQNNFPVFGQKVGKGLGQPLVGNGDIYAPYMENPALVLGPLQLFVLRAYVIERVFRQVCKQDLPFGPRRLTLAHFKDGSVDGFFAVQECFTQIRAQQVQHYWDVVQVFFDFWETRKDLLTLLQKNNLLLRVFEQSYQYSTQIFEFVRSKEIAASYALPLPYLLAYSVGGMHSMLVKWVEKGMEIPSSELVAMLKAGFASSDI